LNRVYTDVTQHLKNLSLMKNIISLLVVMILTSCSDSKSKLEIYSTAESTQSPTAESNEETIKEETKSNKERESYIIDMILKK